jgi:predicted aspartyl protease
MTEPFNPSARRVIVRDFVVGPIQAHEYRFLLDTGANQTSMRAEFLSRLGFNPASATRRTRMRSVTGTATAPLLTVPHLRSLGHTRTDFEIAAHDPPAAVQADGLLGMDFFLGLVLTIDCARGRVSLTRPQWWRFWR